MQFAMPLVRANAWAEHELLALAVSNVDYKRTRAPKRPRMDQDDDASEADLPLKRPPAPLERVATPKGVVWPVWEMIRATTARVVRKWRMRSAVNV